MEASTLFLVPRFPVSLPKSRSINRPLLFTTGKSNSHHHSTALQCHKMYVPGYGASPETNAAKHLHDFFTYIAVKIVYAQLLSSNKEGYYDLMQFLENHSLSDGDKFCADLMRESSRHKSLALRILEVRSAYCKSEFEWDNLKRLSTKMVEERNARVMREYVSETSSVKTKSEK